jgi:hypothetical protein
LRAANRSKLVIERLTEEHLVIHDAIQDVDRGGRSAPS